MNDPNSARPSRPELSDDAAAQQLLTFFRSSRWLSPVGNSFGAIIFVLCQHGRIPTAVLTIWCAVTLVVVCSVTASYTGATINRHTDRDGLPWSSIIGYIATGTLWGATPWLQLSNDGAVSRWISLCLMFAVSAGVLGSVSGLTRLARGVMLPMWVIGSAAFIVTGQYVIAAGGFGFVVLMLRFHTGTARLLVELIRLREVSSAQMVRAEWEATHDALTGLPNRAGLLALAEEGRRSARSRGTSSTTAMFVDLDHFKEVNDRFGHLAGDTLLAEAAKRLRSTVRPEDVVGRLGGDEFLVLIFREVSDIATAKLAERIITALEEPFTLATDDVYVSASIGITRVDQHHADVHRLIHESDKALAEAKRNGRRQAVVFDSGLRAQLTERSGLELALRKAIRSNQIEAWGQPVIELATGRVAWVELLARWEVSPGSFVPPSVFIPLAEEIGVVGDLGRQMLAHASSALRRWQAHPALRGAGAAVNISALHIVREDLVADVSQLIACDDMPAQHLIIELTESHRLTDIDRVAATFRRLGAVGVRLAVDDFGTGYSSLGQLLALPVSIVKIDHSLTSGCDQDIDRADVVRAIRQLAGALGHVVVAEGIETPMESEVMAQIGIDQVQGYLFCPPLPLPELEEELITHGSNWSEFSRGDRSKSI